MTQDELNKWMAENPLPKGDTEKFRGELDSYFKKHGINTLLEIKYNPKLEFNGETTNAFWKMKLEFPAGFPLRTNYSLIVEIVTALLENNELYMGKHRIPFFSPSTLEMEIRDQTCGVYLPANYKKSTFNEIGVLK